MANCVCGWSEWKTQIKFIESLAISKQQLASTGVHFAGIQLPSMADRNLAEVGCH